MRQFVITKKIAKHGNQAIIVIPRMLESELKPGTIVKVTMDILGSLDNTEKVGNNETRRGSQSGD